MLQHHTLVSGIHGTAEQAYKSMRLTVSTAQHIQVLVNNAGAYGRRLPLSELTAEDMLYAFKVNALGPFLCVQQLCNRGLLGSVPSIESPSTASEQQPAGQPAATSLIVNISSIVASHGDTTVSATSPSGYAYR